MRRRKLLVALAGLAVVTGALIALFLLRPGSSRITEARYDLIKAGMTRAEIETVLGPAANSTTRLVRLGPTDRMDFFTGMIPAALALQCGLTTTEESRWTSIVPEKLP
jgi:hypothetical protein